MGPHTSKFFLLLMKNTLEMGSRVTQGQRTPCASGRAGLKGGQRGQLPGAQRSKGDPRDDIYLF